MAFAETCLNTPECRPHAGMKQECMVLFPGQALNRWGLRSTNHFRINNLHTFVYKLLSSEWKSQLKLPQDVASEVVANSYKNRIRMCNCARWRRIWE